MNGDRNRLYTEARDFYELDGSVVMKLSPLAALNVCRTAANHGLIVARIEGGIWHDPGFEARYDSIWDGADPPLGVEVAVVNNNAAAEFVEGQSQTHSAFILTTPPITGCPHKLPKDPV